LSLPPPSAEPTPPAGASYMQKHNNGGLLVAASAPGAVPNSTAGDANHRNSAPAVTGNKENANPVDFVIRRPRNCALLNVSLMENILFITLLIFPTIHRHINPRISWPTTTSIGIRMLSQGRSERPRLLI